MLYMYIKSGCLQEDIALRKMREIYTSIIIMLDNYPFYVRHSSYVYMVSDTII